MLTSVKPMMDWKEAPSNNLSDGRVILTLLSDAILLGPDGQPAHDLDPILGAEHQQAFAEMRLVGGFNRKWGLPLPQSLALQAGSVFVYRAEDIQKEVLDQLQQKGIGERRSEGFGRVAVNWQGRSYYDSLTTKELSQPETERIADIAPLLTLSASKKMAAKMAERQYRAQLEQRLSKAVSSLRIENPPQPSQLSRLRSAVRLAIQFHDLGVIPAHVQSLKSAADQLERAWVVDRPENEPSASKPVRLNEWLRKYVDPSVQHQGNSLTIWSKYLTLETEPAVAGIGLSAKTLVDIQVEYTARLLDALFRRTTRKIQEEQEKGGIRGRSMG